MKVFRSQCNQWSIGIGVRRSTIYDNWRWSLWINHGYRTITWCWSRNPQRPAMTKQQGDAQ
jgi:hypothetical protein